MMKALAVGLLVVGMAFALASPAWASETFGVESFASSIVSNAGGAPAIQAGSHPYALTMAIVFNHVITAIGAGQPPRVSTYGDPRDIELNLPAGTIVDPRATGTRCTESELESPEGPASCPNGAAVGVFSIYLDGIEVLDEPVYNMAPPASAPVELGLNAAGIGLIMHVGGRLRTGTDYGLTANTSEISDEHPIYGLEITLWGNPSNASHDEERGLCAGQKAKQSFKKTGIHESCPMERTSTPFLTLPSSCTGEPLTTTLSTDSWQEPGPLDPDGTPDLSDPLWQTASSSSPPLTGCSSLDFNPKVTVSTAEPAAAHAESPSGLSIDLKLPEEESVNSVAGADPKEAAVTLPAGFAISPAAAGGREACTPAEIELNNAKIPTCPEAATVGAVKIATPLLEDPLEGSLYLAQPYANDPAFGSGEHPGGSLLALYLVVEVDGMLVKLAGRVEASTQTGQLTITFTSLPQLPISEMRLSLYGGERALLVTPAACGSYEVQSTLTPWSGTPAVTQTSNLEIDSGPGGGGCPNGRFDPSFMAGTADNQAGAFSPFSLTFSRRDGEQRFGAYSVRLAPGLLGILKNIALCPEPQASLGQCPQASAIGTTTVGAGPGEDPFYLPEPVQPTNEVYLTGPVPPAASTLPEGLNQSRAPFGLSIVVPAIAGPFNLGDLVIRASIAIDPRTAQLTITSDPLPTIEAGIPLDIRTLNVSIDRPGFIFNPTGCTPRAVTGTVSSTGGASAAVSSPFQAVNCASLSFKPVLSVLTHAQTSKANGAYLHVKVISGPGQANIAKVKVDLPKQLPSRLTTLHRACRATVFDVNPAACPAAAVVGTAWVVTPLVRNQLTGPAYLVSHGGVAFPDLEIVLQGEGIRLILDGDTSIRKGVISEAFRTLPDVPVSAFDLILPTGPDSLLSANLPKAKRSLCGQKLQIAVALTGQNGAVVKQSEKALVSGCTVHKAKTSDEHRRQRR